MEIILSKYCKSFTGTISRYHGYAIRKTGNRYLSCRTNSRHATPDGHWRFILACAELAKQGFMLSDIRISQDEIMDALHEIGRDDYLWKLKFPNTLNASEFLTLKSELGL